MGQFEKPQKFWINLRMAAVCVVISMLFLVVIGRVYLLQTVENEDLRKKADVQASRVLKMKAKRGSIYDRNGVEIAVSVESPSIAVRPGLVGDPDRLAKQLAPILNQPETSLLEKLHSKRGFIWLARQSTPEVASAVRRLHEKGLEVHLESQRFYPLASLAGQLIGFTNIDGVGLEGLESAFEKRLAGKEFLLEGVRDAHGRTLLTESVPEFTQFEGESLILTIDERLQRVAEQQLKETVKQYQAKGGYAVVMDVKTGDILAIANTPDFNPNFFSEYTPNDWRLRNITDTFEPGSVIKPLVLAAALQEKGVRINSLFDCEGGRIRIGKYTIRDSHRSDILSAAEVIQHSSNICIYKIAQTIGKQKLYDYLKSFGFGSRSGLGLKGEQPGLLWPPDKWAEVSFANIAFGQGLTSTPLQVTAAIAAIANDGMLMKPQIVKRILDKEGGIVKENTPTLVRRVVSPKVAKQTAWTMSLVSREGGTGWRAALADFTVAGKTGTAQKVNPKTRRYDPHMWTASYVGFVPAEKPEVAITVLIDEPMETHYGGVVAAPAFKEIAKEALKILGTSRLPKSQRFKFFDAQAMRNEYKERQKMADMTIELPELELPEVALPPIKINNDDMTLMPDLTGMTLRQAIEKMKERGFLPNVTGWGKVVAQNPNPGEKLQEVKQIDITLAPYESAKTLFAQEPSQGDLDELPLD